MNFSKNIILPFTMLLAVVMIIMWLTPPKAELIISIFIRLLSFTIAIYFVIKYREWRIMFLAAMFFLMAARQILTFSIWTGAIEKSEIARTLSELPGFVVTLLSLLSIVYLGMILSGKSQLIQEQKNSINTLKNLLPICAKCKKIRDDEGYWKEIDSYIESHTDSKFSHGLCEECSDKLYGNEAWYQEMKMKQKKMK